MDLTLGNTKILIQEGLKAGLLRNQMAYVLATAYWETGRTMRPIKEMGGEKYLRSKKYYPYFGRGYVQLTWDYNYAKAGKKIGVDLMDKNMDRALEPVYAADICIRGMIEGWFTGKKLSDYITLQKSDFVNARKIINGKDKADTIAEFAHTYDDLLKKSGYGDNKPIEAPSVPVGMNMPSTPHTEGLQPIPDNPGVIPKEEVKTSVEHSPGYSEPATNFIETLLKIFTQMFGAKK